MFFRTLGRSKIKVSALGMGCWAIGGPFWRDGQPIGWGQVDDEQSVRAIRRAVELGVTLFDTADVYGCGHSERVLANALAGVRQRIYIATKFGKVFDENSRQAFEERQDPPYIRAACEASLQRLNVDRIDLYQFHNGTFDPAMADDILETLEDLVSEGKIRWYGWSSDSPAAARAFATGKHCTAVQQALNLLSGRNETLAVCDELNFASLNRNPLGKGLLTGKFDQDSKLPADDNRSRWDLKGGGEARLLERFNPLRDLLTCGGHSLAQAALAWLWAVSEKTIPIPGFKNVQQVEENIKAADRGLLSPEQMRRIDEILGR